MTKEIWRDIKGYEDVYQISNKGRERVVVIDSFEGADALFK